MHDYASSLHTINPPLLLSSVPQCSQANPKHSFTGSRESPACNNDSFSEIEYLDEYLDQSNVSDTNNDKQSSSSIACHTITAGAQGARSEIEALLSSSGGNGIHSTSNVTSSNRRRRPNAPNELLDFLKKDAKRQKKENGYFFKMMAAFGKAQNINIPEYGQASDYSGSSESD